MPFEVLVTLAEIYSYLEDIMPAKRVLISLAIGMVSLLIVLVSGLTSDFVRGETVASRTFSAFCFTGLTSFILMMSCEEYAIFKTKRELERFIDDAQIADTSENFNKEEYFREDEPAEQTAQDNSFRPLDFSIKQADT